MMRAFDTESRTFGKRDHERPDTSDQDESSPEASPGTCAIFRRLVARICLDDDSEAHRFTGLEVLITLSRAAELRRHVAGILRVARFTLAYPLAVDDEHIYARAKADFHWLAAAPKLGGAPVLLTLIASTSSGRGFAMDEERLYFSDSSSISSIAKDGTAPVRIASEELSAQAIAATTSCVYWSGLDDTNTGHVRAASALGDGDVVTIAEGTQLGASMVADESGVYWVDPPKGTITSLSR